MIVRVKGGEGIFVFVFLCLTVTLTLVTTVVRVIRMLRGRVLSQGQGQC